MRMKTKLGIIAACLLLLGGCNTVEGVGMDMSAGARTVGGWMSSGR